MPDVKVWLEGERCLVIDNPKKIVYHTEEIEITDSKDTNFFIVKKKMAAIEIPDGIPVSYSIH